VYATVSKVLVQGCVFAATGIRLSELADNRSVMA
jgi:hypothetical protein